jgi:hypothetical protein
MNPVLGAMAISLCIVILVYALCLFVSTLVGDDWEDNEEE